MANPQNPQPVALLDYYFYLELSLKKHKGKMPISAKELEEVLESTIRLVYLRYGLNQATVHSPCYEKVKKFKDGSFIAHLSIFMDSCPLSLHAMLNDISAEVSIAVFLKLKQCKLQVNSCQPRLTLSGKFDLDNLLKKAA